MVLKGNLLLTSKQEVAFGCSLIQIFRALAGEPLARYSSCPVDKKLIPGTFYYDINKRSFTTTLSPLRIFRYMLGW